MLDIVTDATPHTHPAIQLCLQAGRTAHSAARALNKSDYECEKSFTEAYLKSLPALATQDSISDFIACITYAQVIGVLYRDDVRSHLYAAQVALCAVPRTTTRRKTQAA